MAYTAQHATRFGFYVASRDAEGSAVTSCVCRFCDVFGREESATQEHDVKQKTGKIKYFQAFRPDLYTQHLTTERSQEWTAYQLLSNDVDKIEFFSAVAVPFANKVTAHFDKSPELSFVINAAIVAIIVGELLFHHGEFDDVTHQRALRLFELSSTAGEYRVVIKTPKRCALVVGVVATGASFHHATRIVKLVRDETGLAYYGGCSGTLASSYARVICTDALQKLSDAFSCITGFSLALDLSTVNGMPFLDRRCRFTAQGVLYNFYLLALPLYGQHTGRLLTDALIKFLDALHAPWRDIMVGVATDGASAMTGRARDVATLLEHEVSESPRLAILFVSPPISAHDRGLRPNASSLYARPALISLGPSAALCQVVTCTA